MTIREQLKWWGAGVALLALGLWGLRDALLPFLVGAAIAYFADPLVDRLEAHSMSRTWATIVITVLTAALALMALLVLVPLMLEQIREFIANAPIYAGGLRTFLTDVGANYMPELMAKGSPLQSALASLRTEAEQWSIELLKQAWSSGLAIIDLIVLMVVTPVVAFYLLLDWDHMIERIDKLLPRDHAETIRGVARDIDKVLAGFVRGQLSVCAIVGAYYATGLMLVGLDFGLLIGIFAGLISFIPFVGSTLGLLLSVGLALFQFWPEPEPILLVAAVFVSGQFVEGNILTPRLVGGSVCLHPVWLMFALSVFGAMMGFTGLLVAVPLAAALGVLTRFAVEKYQSGRLYRGSEDSES